MNIEEAIEILKKRCEYYKKVNECGFDKELEYLALDTVLQALEKLKKENEKYRSGELLTAKQVKSFEETNKKYYIHKDKIKEKIEQLKKVEKNCRKNGLEKNSHFCKIQMSILQELLKGE